LAAKFSFGEAQKENVNKRTPSRIKYWIGRITYLERENPK
jgi:hypothetical protein